MDRQNFTVRRTWVYAAVVASTGQKFTSLLVTAAELLME
jgi:hypothetical protein